MQSCSRCKVELPFTAFAKNRTKKSGYQATCKVCKKKYDKKRIATKQPTNQNILCARCGRDQPAETYYVNRYTANGRSTICTPCIKAKATLDKGLAELHRQIQTDAANLKPRGPKGTP
jgi:hypothetical protein